MNTYKNSLLIFLLCISITSKIQGQTINFGFENWTSFCQGNFGCPTGWTTNSSSIGQDMVGAVSGHASPYAAWLKFFQSFPGYPTYGGNIYHTSAPTGGLPLTLSCWFRLQTQNPNLGHAEVTIRVYDSSSWIQVGYGYLTATPAPGWSQYSTSINYSSTPSTVYYQIDIRNVPNSSSGSTDYSVIVDDLILTYNATGVNNLEQSPVRSYIVSNDDQTLDLVLTSSQNANSEITITDLSGRKLFSHKLHLINGEQKINLPVAGYSNGLYLCTVEGINFHNSLKFSVNK